MAVDEFEKIMAQMEGEQQTEASKHDEYMMYIHEDKEFRLAVINHISELTGVKTGKELFTDGKA